MELEKETFNAQGIKILARDGDKIVGRVFLYILKNDLHDKPFGFAEDLFVEETHRKQGIGSKLLEEAIAEAKNQGCYKLVCTSRHEKPELHSYYKKFGFKDRGLEFRMDF